jgi:hypothetical protein
MGFVDLTRFLTVNRRSTSPENAIEASDWATVRDEAAREHNRRTASYLLGMPLLADFLEEGLSMLGRSCDEFEANHL